MSTGNFQTNASGDPNRVTIKDEQEVRNVCFYSSRLSDFESKLKLENR